MKRLGPDEVVALCKKHGAFRSGHFRLAGGEHSDTHIDMESALDDPAAGAALGQAVALRWFESADAPRPQAVIGPVKGGAKLAILAAQAFNEMAPSAPPVLSVSVEKDGAGGFCLTEPAKEILRGTRVLAVEDVATTGNSLAQAIAAAHEAHATVLGAIVALNRGNVRELRVESVRRIPRREPLYLPLQSLASLPIVSHAAEGCPLCAAEVPISTDIGHGKAFLSSRSNPARSS